MTQRGMELVVPQNIAQKLLEALAMRTEQRFNARSCQQPKRKGQHSPPLSSSPFDVSYMSLPCLLVSRAPWFLGLWDSVHIEKLIVLNCLSVLSHVGFILGLDGFRALRLGNFEELVVFEVLEFLEPCWLHLGSCWL